ncbi:unnamed protein product [Adineta ricciae]|uniref:GH16 domain-containing protein n=1 Tax=Adineta ricciae TaxID=249248 RepID=A0A815YYX3_ADIRI|nr:unnamed protein product [Adineta ricciae]
MIAGKVQWYGQNWARACDFFANDLSNVRSLPEHCGPKCEQTPRCTHFAWNRWNGGTCWMKHGSASKNDAFSTSDSSMICGVLGQHHNHVSNNRNPNSKGWRLIWEDNFDWTGLVDTAKWDFDVGGHGFGNNEKQYYTNNRWENARCELFPHSNNGRLIIEARHEHMHGSSYTSARMKSKQKWTYGRLQIRAKLPTGRGLWPALWMLPERQTYSNTYWPDNGEIDLMEQVGYEPARIHSSIHTKAHNHMIHTHKTDSAIVDDATSNFKIYTLDWYPDKIQTFVGDDGDPFAKHIFTWDKQGDWTKWPFDKPFFVIMNIAVGGNWGGQRGIDNNIFPGRMEIDWVRFYQQS